MAALTKDRITETKLPGLKAYPVAASTKIYANSLVCLNTSGYLVPAADTVGFVCMGIADEQIDNSSGAAGDLWCKVKSPIIARLDCTSITQAMLGRKVYVVDDHTVDEEFQNLTNSVLAGVLVEFISAIEGWISIDPNVNAALNAPDEIVTSFSGAGNDVLGSREMLARDLTVAAAAGSANASNPAMLSGARFRIFGATLTKAGNYIGAMFARYGITGVKSTTLPAGAAQAWIEDGVTDVDGAVVAYIDNTSAATKALAAFKSRMARNVAGDGYDYGMDLYDAGFATILKALLRSPNEVAVLEKAGAPVDGVAGTGAGFAGRGSLLVDYTNGTLYQNTGTKASPTWMAR